MINSMRSIGYSFEAAVADIFDNSIAACSTTLHLQIRKDPAYVALIDDGTGMAADTLIEAMRLGSVSPTGERRSTDHGRFGLGLKTASLSQCRRLTVVSKYDGAIAAARWDLDEVERTNTWSLLLLDPQECSSVPCFQQLEQQTTGTVVIWEQFDRIGSSQTDKNAGDALIRVASESSEHLSLIFHRLMDGSAGRELRIYLNGTRLDPADPFLLKNPYTRLVGQESARINGSSISAIAYILPRFNQISSQQLKAAGGASKMRDLQGFFVYRNFRLIMFGTWFRLAVREELTRLARVQVDIDNTADETWNLDIKKASVNPPAAVRQFLSTMVAYVVQESVRRFKPKVSGAQIIENAALWLRISRHDIIYFAINRAHPVIKACLSERSQVSSRSITAMLDALELSLPIKQLYFDQAANHNVAYDDDQAEARLQAIFEILVKDLAAEDRADVIRDLPFLEPFRSHPTFTAKLRED